MPAAPSRNALLAAWMSGLTLFCAAGCSTSHQLPAPLSPEERALVERSRLDLVVGLEKRYYPDPLALEALRRSGMFKRVDYLEQLKSPPDVLVRGASIVQGSPVIPIFTFASLGFIPTKTYERWGYSYTFHSQRPDDVPVEVEVSHRSPTVLGRLSHRLNKTPDWSEDSPNEHQRMFDRLALNIALKASEIRDLSAKSSRGGARVRKVRSGFIVLALAGTRTDCVVVPWNTYSKTQSKVFGPAPDAVCRKWVAENCRPAP